MENTIDFVDRLSAVTDDLVGVSQLMMAVYEDMHRDGLDAEYLLVLDSVIGRCREELDALNRVVNESIYNK